MFESPRRGRQARNFTTNVPKILDLKSSSEQIFSRKLSLGGPEILPFVTQYNPSVPNLKHILMEKWHLIESQPKLREMFKEPPIISYKRGISLKDILVRAKL